MLWSTDGARVVVDCRVLGHEPQVAPMEIETLRCQRCGYPLDDDLEVAETAWVDGLALVLMLPLMLLWMLVRGKK